MKQEINIAQLMLKALNDVKDSNSLSVFEKMADFYKVEFPDFREYIGTCLEPFRTKSKEYALGVQYFTNCYYMYCWRKYKKIYNIDSDLLLALEKTDVENLNMKEQMSTLPFNGMALVLNTKEAECIRWNKDSYKVAVITSDSENLYISIFDLVKNQIKNHSSVIADMNVFMPLDNISIEKAIKVLMDGIYKNSNNDRIDPDIIEKLIRQIINSILYIKSANADLEKSPFTRNTHKNSSMNIIKDVYREIDSTEVGIKIGAVIRKHKYDGGAHCKTNKSEETHKRIPHLRCGHWHTYWVGPRDKPELRHTIIRWVSPVFVNGKLGTEASYTVIHPVK